MSQDYSKYLVLAVDDIPLKTVRENPATADIKVVILSAPNSNDDIVKGFKLGADDFLAKPIIMEKLVDCVLKQLEAVGEK